MKNKFILNENRFSGLEQINPKCEGYIQYKNPKSFLLSTVFLLIFVTYTPFSLASNQDGCFGFNKVVNQLTLAQNGMRSALNLKQLNQLLGIGTVGPTIITTTYSWVYKDRILLVKTKNGDISAKLLTGTDDGSPISRKMEELNEKLKSATSIWIIKDIEYALGKSYVSESTTTKTYSWNCGVASLETTTDKDGELISANISYKAPTIDIIENQIAQPQHVRWDIIDDHTNYSYRQWQRSFKKDL
jgi:hypothetical protein